MSESTTSISIKYKYEKQLHIAAIIVIPFYAIVRVIFSSIEVWWYPEIISIMYLTMIFAFYSRIVQTITACDEILIVKYKYFGTRKVPCYQCSFSEKRIFLADIYIELDGIENKQELLSFIKRTILHPYEPIRISKRRILVVSIAQTVQILALLGIVATMAKCLFPYIYQISYNYNINGIMISLSIFGFIASLIAMRRVETLINTLKMAGLLLFLPVLAYLKKYFDHGLEFDDWIKGGISVIVGVVCVHIADAKQRNSKYE
jgi:hypothetical protein